MNTMTPQPAPPVPKPSTADKDLARSLGVQASAVTLHRLTLEEQDYHAETGYTPSGIQRIKALLGLPAGDSPEIEGQDKGQPPAETQTPELLKVIKRCPNPTFVVVRTPQGGAALINVRKTKTLNPGKFLQCVKREEKWICVQQGYQPRGSV
jgi:hypothetical protein